MATDIQALTKDYLFEAGLLYSAVAEKREWLVVRYKELADDRSSGEVTSTMYDGQSANVQFRGSTPEERRTALRQAIEQCDALLENEKGAAGAPRLFGFRFTDSPHTAL